MDALALNNQICFPLYQASRVMIKAYQPLLAKFELTYPQYLVLLVLWKESPLPVNDIAQQLDLKTNTITPLLQRMEKSEYVTRQRSSDDERKVLVHLTPKAEEIKKEIECVPMELLSKSGFEMERLLQLKSELNELIKNIQNNTK